MSSNAGKMTPVLWKISARGLLFHQYSVHINFGQHGRRVVRHCQVSPVARGNDGKGDHVEHFFVVFLVVIPDYLPIQHSEVILVVFVIRMASDRVK